MNQSDLKSVLAKEWLDFSRNWSVVGAILLLSILFPLMLLGGSYASQQMSERNEKTRVAVDGPVGIALKDLAANDVKVVDTPKGENALEGLSAQHVDAVIKIPPTAFHRDADSVAVPGIQIFYRPNEDGEAAVNQASAALIAVSDKIKFERLKSQTLSKPWFDTVAKLPFADSMLKKTGTIALMTMMPSFLTFIISSVSACLSTELINVERNKKTWRILLGSGVDRASLLCGKLVFCSITLLAACIVCMAFMVFCASIARTVAPSFAFEFTGLHALTVCVLSIPLGISMSAFFFMLCLCARNTQEINTFLSPALLVILILPWAALLPSSYIAPALYVVPVLNTALCIRETLAAEPSAMHLITTLATSGLVAFLCIRGCLKLMNNEELLFNLRTPSQYRSNFTPTIVVLCTTVFILFVYLGQTIIARDTFWGMLIVQSLFFVLPAWYAVRHTKLDVKETMSLRKPRWQQMLGAFLLAPAMMALAGALATVQNAVLPAPSMFEETMKKLIMEGRPLWQTLISMAVTPGICEELLFRGAIMGLLRKNSKPVNACLITGVMFGLFHMSSFRLAATTMAGIILGAVTISTGSIFPSMLLHAAYNSSAIIFSMHEHEAQAWWLAPILGCAVAGIVLLGWYPRRSSRQRIDKQ